MIPILITTINKTTKAISEFKKKENVKIVIVGDKKSTPFESDEKIDFLSIKSQLEKYPDISKLLPYNHYSRKNIGYIHIIKNYKSNFFYETDDDNIPYENWEKLITSFDAKEKIVSEPNSFINIYRLFTNEFVWPRGYPIEKLKSEKNYEIIKNNQKIGIIQGLADKEPDVDSIYRLIFNKKIIFKKRENICVGKFLYSPINSQNTSWLISLAPLCYLPCKVSFRYTDILRGMIAQRILWEMNLNIAYSSSSVYQERNQHNLMKDFIDEVPMFKNQLEVMNILSELKLEDLNIIDSMKKTYMTLEKKKIVGPGETKILNTYLSYFEG